MPTNAQLVVSVQCVDARRFDQATYLAVESRERLCAAVDRGELPSVAHAKSEQPAFRLPDQGGGDAYAWHSVTRLSQLIRDPRPTRLILQWTLMDSHGRIPLS
jgi:hypothetical protein